MNNDGGLVQIDNNATLTLIDGAQIINNSDTLATLTIGMDGVLDVEGGNDNDGLGTYLADLAVTNNNGYIEVGKSTSNASLTLLESHLDHWRHVDNRSARPRSMLSATFTATRRSITSSSIIPARFRSMKVRP